MMHPFSTWIPLGFQANHVPKGNLVYHRVYIININRVFAENLVELGFM